MYSTNKIAEAILNGKFDEAKTLLANGEILCGQYVENNKSQLFSSVIRHKAFDMVPAFINAGQIHTDIYEYENFDRSFFRNIAMELKEDDESINFLMDFLQKIDGKNEEVNDQTLLGYCLEKEAAPAVLEAFLEVGCDAHYKNNAEQNFLHMVVSKNMLAEEKGLVYLERLIFEGVDVNSRDIVGQTPLMKAVKAQRYKYVSCLLQYGSNANVQDRQGNSAWYFAVAEQFDPQMFALLCEYGTPDFDMNNQSGVNFFGEFMRMMNGSSNEMKLLDLLLKAGGSFTKTSLYYHQPKSGVDWLAEKPFNVLQMALNEGAVDVNGRDDAGNTILHKVCAYNVNYDKEAARDLYKKVKLLLEAGADLFMTNDKDETPLMLAQQDNLKIKTVELLMSKK